MKVLWVIAMSILKYFKPGSKTSTSKTEIPPVYFPNPSGSLSLEMPSTSIAAANKAVEEVLEAEGEVKRCLPLPNDLKSVKIGIAQTLRFYKRKFPDLVVLEPT